ncbi:cholesterol transport system auxiliary component [Serratia fonticola]|uniref:Cholesterol transport system auxiliary component n=1 Tax=Serratia fonticola TaxID=47917 RepID=A0A542BRR4_SERFO|nr:ABC-type transport auxiliary lipoprotein family protein [Serratia fonticola]TQI81272.1 cholesterol transport system auxiliary component [Serratia fonticola]TQI96704.1 cholesterol transport system auxiliary component [Serratia fonticola]TVZ71201.1 cholesterol transport system auxiliary component [Serratia fonticola]
MISFNAMPARLRRHCLRLLALVVFMPLAACTILPESPVLQVYMLPAQPAASAAGGAIDRSLRIVQPNTSQFLNGARIAVQPQGAELTVYSGSRWSDSNAILLRNRLIQEFRINGQFRSVSSDDDNLQADLELGGDLSSFQGVYNGDQGEVVIRFDARLVQTADRRVIANRSFVVRQPINGKSMDNVVTAFGLASDRLAAQMLGWTRQQMATRG